MRIDTGYNYYLLIYLSVIFIYLFLFLFLSLVLGLSPTTFQICINPSTTSRIAFKHHIVKQINYCNLMISDIVHVMLYTAQQGFGTDSKIASTFEFLKLTNGIIKKNALVDHK